MDARTALLADTDNDVKERQAVAALQGRQVAAPDEQAVDERARAVGSGAGAPGLVRNFGSCQAQAHTLGRGCHDRGGRVAP